MVGEPAEEDEGRGPDDQPGSNEIGSGQAVQLGESTMPSVGDVCSQPV